MRAPIVDRGPGGPYLADGPRKSAVHVHVHERHTGPAGGPASYGVHLDADGPQELRACLPSASSQR